MPDRYHIHTVPTPARFRRVGKFGSVDWREDCSRCTNCVKLRCLYDVYRHEAAYNRDPLTLVDTLDECKACLSCVQGCTKGLLSVSVNQQPSASEPSSATWNILAALMKLRWSSGEPSSRSASRAFLNAMATSGAGCSPAPEVTAPSRKTK